jgi:hypothetical protein
MALVVERLFALSDAGDFASEQYALGERPVHQDIRQPDIHQESRVS